jgi:N utilization substance protein B
MKARRRSRIIALQTIYSYEIAGSPVEQLLDFGWVENSESLSQDIVYFSSVLIKGCIDNIRDIDNIINSSLDHWKMERISKVELSILRLAVFEMFFMDDIPARVSINEAVEVAKLFGTDDSFKFVNGVLDGIRKKIENEKENR